MKENALYQLHHGDCLTILPTLPNASVDAVICDPPYAEVVRDYGRMSENEWFDLMRPMVRETRRILKPTGSAVFILQPNSSKLGSMRAWLWKFMVWCHEEWNIVQDAYWWNIATMPGFRAELMRPSMKYCVWLGESNCYRNQKEVLWKDSQENKILKTENRLNIRKEYVSGHSVNRSSISNFSALNNGVTPFNVLPISHSSGKYNAGSFGHGAGTPIALADWWIRYICPPGGTIADWCMGSGTMGIAAAKNERNFIGIELYPLLDKPIHPKDNPDYFSIASQRIHEAYTSLPLFEAMQNT